jgi:hypothetical protein
MVGYVSRLSINRFCELFSILYMSMSIDEAQVSMAGKNKNNNTKFPQHKNNKLKLIKSI